MLKASVITRDHLTIMSQIAEREVLKCLTYLALEQQVAKGLFSIEQLPYGILYNI